ncbi:PREDICTED: synaptonemal complex central element protein 2 [Calidris pugnax]|uniref:synaptonemal complex central element protein 2-like n=1 Tax=Calidris pugnax TaxID=198806 RepID=UPI00071C5D41|nr:PREDICTED: synaptonemal complex central element protein 2-like [Calidris pugnax]XP_014817000.1 PREDICTED: synaptonemal complex central element protein 2 [Calidris pugnax]
MSGFRESLLLKVSGLAEQLEERLFHLYGLHNELIQERLQELAEVMERVGQAEDELRQVCHTVEAAYRDLCLQPET